MKVCFKSQSHRIAFATDGDHANLSIAEYMGDGVHEAIQYPNGMIELVDENKEEIILGRFGQRGVGNGFRACFFDDEHQYLTITE